MRQAGLDWAALPDYVRLVLDQGVTAVQVQVQSQRAEDMLRDAHRYIQWAEPGQVVVKIPITREGLIGAKELSKQEIPVTMTAVYGVEQALWAAMVGADYAAPYLGRLNDQGTNGLEVIRSMQAVLNQPKTNPHPSIRLLVASLRTKQMVTDMLEVGVGAITIPPALFGELVERSETLEAEKVFLADAIAMNSSA